LVRQQTFMSEHEKVTAFLHHCICYDESPGRQALEDSLTRIQRDERCVHRGIRLMVLVALVAVAVFSYCMIFVETFPQDTSLWVVKIIAALGAASVICLTVFTGLRIIYRARLDERREECRQLIMKLLVSRLGQPVSLPPQHNNGSVQNFDGRLGQFVSTHPQDKEGGIPNFAGRLDQPVRMRPQNNGSS